MCIMLVHVTCGPLYKMDSVPWRVQHVPQTLPGVMHFACPSEYTECRTMTIVNKLVLGVSVCVVLAICVPLSGTFV